MLSALRDTAQLRARRQGRSSRPGGHSPSSAVARPLTRALTRPRRCRHQRAPAAEAAPPPARPARAAADMGGVRAAGRRLLRRLRGAEGLRETCRQYPLSCCLLLGLGTATLLLNR